MGDEDALLQVLLPDTAGFDLAVNRFRFQPGAALPLVEIHVMEHGLIMLEGQGVYRLGDAWYPVRAGDVISISASGSWTWGPAYRVGPDGDPIDKSDISRPAPPRMTMPASKRKRRPRISMCGIVDAKPSPTPNSRPDR